LPAAITNKAAPAGSRLVSAFSTHAQPAKITVGVAHPGHVISPTLWGIFFEDINLSADGRQKSYGQSPCHRTDGGQRCRRKFIGRANESFAQIGPDGIQRHDH